MHGDRKFIQNIRRDYLKDGLLEENIDSDPVLQFSKWFSHAIDENLVDGNAMTLATSAGGRPNARVVLLKSFDQEGFTFYTNYGSKKSLELEENDQATLLFYWAEFERQVKICGTVKKTSREESEEYFHSRPRESQIGAMASRQSETLQSRNHLEEVYKKLNKDYEGKDVPLPSFWGGFTLKPDYFEFWQGRPNRLHDRIIYDLLNGSWQTKRLYP